MHNPQRKTLEFTASKLQYEFTIKRWEMTFKGLFSRLKFLDAHWHDGAIHLEEDIAELRGHSLKGMAFMVD